MGNGRVRLKAHHFLLFLLYSEVAGRGGSGGGGRGASGARAGSGGKSGGGGNLGGAGFAGTTGSLWSSELPRRATLRSAYFRGNISSADIYNALFSARHRIFSTYSSYVFGADPIAATTTTLTVRNASLPFIIGNSSLIFFWRSPLASENCNEYDVSNVEDMRVVFCKSKVERHLLKANYGPAAACCVRIFVVRRNQASEPSEFTDFSWFCPTDTACCEWECCDSDGWTLAGFMHGFRIALAVVDIILIIVLGVPLVSAGCFLSCKCIDWTRKWGERFVAEAPNADADPALINETTGV